MGRSLRNAVTVTLAAAAVTGLLAGCGKAGDGSVLSTPIAGTRLISPGGNGAPGAPGAGQPGAGGTDTGTAGGAGSGGTEGFVTEDTTRVGAASAITNAAAIARAVFPGMNPQSRPQAVALVDDRDWRTALAAAVLMSAPLRAPLLYTDGGQVPATTSSALLALAPAGAPALSDAQVIRVGPGAGLAQGYATLALTGSTPASLAVTLEQIGSEVRGSPPHHVLIVNGNAPAAWSMPAAGLAAESGAPILFVHNAGIPPATRRALSALKQPAIYVIGPASVVSTRVAGQLAHYGTVTRISGETPVANAIAVAQYVHGGFGWGVVDPGHGLVFVNQSHPLDAAAAGALSDGGDYGPVLLLANSGAIPAALSSYLASIQPGYTQDPRFAPVRGVYNRGWLIGGAGSISTRTQAQSDALLAIVPRGTPPATSGFYP